MQEFIYLIGETLMLELEDILNVTYTKDAEEMLLETKQGGKFKIMLSKVEN